VLFKKFYPLRQRASVKLLTALHDKCVPVFPKKATLRALKFSDVPVGQDGLNLFQSAADRLGDIAESVPKDPSPPSLFGLISRPGVVRVELMLDWCVAYRERIGRNAGCGVQPDGNEVHCRLEHSLHAVWKAAEVNIELNLSVWHL